MSQFKRHIDQVLGYFGYRPQASSSIFADPRARELVLGGSITAAGVPITENNSFRIPAVNACVRVLAETVASLPLIVYKRLGDGGKERAPDHPVAKLIRIPNTWNTRFEYIEGLMTNLTLRGNHYSIKNQVGGVTRELLPIDPDRVEVEQLRSGALRYKIHPPFDTFSGLRRRLNGKVMTLPQDRVLHIRGLSSDTVLGRNVIADARETMGLSMAEQDHAALSFGKGAKPSGILEHPSAIGPEVRESIEKSWNSTYGGIENVGKTVVLEEGMQWKQISLSAADAQFIENRKFSIADIARFFRVPLHLIQELDRSTNNNIEQQALEFVMHTIRPWLVRIELAMQRDLFGVEEKEFFAEFLVDGLLRGDMKSRFFSYEKAIMSGWMKPNEVRVRENLNPVPEGDTLLSPLNMERTGDTSANDREEK